MDGIGTAQAVLAAFGVTAALVIFVRVVRSESDPFIARVMVLGLFAKLLGSVARYTFMAELYGGVGDYNRYFQEGTRLAGTIRGGSLPEQARQTGTPFVDFLSGVVYTVLPNQLWIGFAVFALLSFIGAVFFLKAFQLAVPDGHHRRFALLIFFLPTMVFWPSSLGKEAWLVFTLGIATYGAARSLRRARFGYVIALVGGAGVFVVRPHMAALLGLAFAGAFVLRFRDPDVQGHALAWLLGLMIVGLGAGYAASNFGDELPRDQTVEGSATEQVFAETTKRTSQGGSGFESRPVRSPVDFLHAAVTVPFRPFPMEAHNRQAQLASLEGLFLLGLLLMSLPRLRTLPRALLRRPFVAMAAAYSVGFIIAFSNVGNFGILVRQRAQLLPFLLVLLCLPLVRQVTSTEATERVRGEVQGVVPTSGQPVLVMLPPRTTETGAGTPSATGRPPPPPPPQG